MTNVSASSSVAIRAVSFTAAPYSAEILKSLRARPTLGSARRSKRLGDSMSRAFVAPSFSRDDRRRGCGHGFVLRPRRRRQGRSRRRRSAASRHSSAASTASPSPSTASRARSQRRAELGPDGRGSRAPAGHWPQLQRDRCRSTFHVVSPDGVIGNISNRIIRDQIRVLNATFGGFEGGYATGFDFTLAGVTRTVNADWYYASIGNDERAMKRALHTGGRQRAQHVPDDRRAVPRLGLPAGHRQQGQRVSGRRSSSTGSRCRARPTRTPAATTRARRQRTRPVTGSTSSTRSSARCNAHGDYVDDTPPEATPTAGCPAGKDTCSDPGLDPIHNYMDYSYDQCYTEFTLGQTLRMQDAWLFYRAP